MHEGLRQRQGGDTAPATPRWQHGVLLVVLLACSALVCQGAHAAERARPLRIGALTASWGPTPQVVGLRDGLRDLGYRDPEHFVLGIRFTQGDTAALTVAARTSSSRRGQTSSSPMPMTLPRRRSWRPPACPSSLPVSRIRSGPAWSTASPRRVGT